MLQLSHVLSFEGIMSAIITLTSDFGSRDAFTASLKGVILKINPLAQMIDVSHEIAPQDIWEAAFTLKSAYSYFPKGTVHLAVVDPGVGSVRRPIIVVTESYYFVGPDNGLFTLIYQEAERIRVHHITATHYFLPNPSHTFHGRDVFAPVAAWLSKGIPSGNFGEEITDYLKLNVPSSKVSAGAIEGHVVHIDRFGNMITNISHKSMQELLGEEMNLASLNLSFAGREIIGLKRFYSETSPGEAGALINSSGFVEIFVFKQNARAVLSGKRGEAVRLSVKK